MAWRKLWRDVIDHPVFINDAKAWRIFETLMLLADDEGNWSGGIMQLAGRIREKKTTVFDGLKRLEDRLMIERRPNAQFTVYHICNWNKYQDIQPNDVRTTADLKPNEDRHSYKTKTKNREENNTTNVVAVADKRNKELQELIDYAKTFQFPLQGTQRANRQAAWNCLKKYNLEPCKKMVEASTRCRGEPYAPSINDFMQLYRKAGDLASFVGSKQKKKGKHVVI